MFDKILGNLDLGNLLGNLDVDGIAEKFGIPTEQAQNIMQSLSGKLGEGGDQISALMEAAQEHGVSLDHVKNLVQNFTQGEGGNPLAGLSDLLGKGMFGGKE